MTTDVPIIRNPSLTDIPVIEEYRVTGVIGEKGSGKSLVAAILAEGARTRENRPVFFFPEKFAFHEGEALQMNDIYTMDVHGQKFYRAVVIIDEIQRVFSKYAAATYRNQAFGSWMQQVRKLGMEVIWTSNDPEEIDSSIIPQTDIHMDCKYIEDERCRAYGYHLSNCTDRVIARVVDTGRKHGRAPGHYDGRKRYTTRFKRVIESFHLYNTYAAVSATEIAMMSKAEVMKAHDEKGASMSVDALEDILIERIIPYVVLKLGWEIVYPRQFAKWLETAQDENGESLEIQVSSKMLGMALKNIGIQSKRNSSGMAYNLPEAGDIENWQTGGA